MYLYHLSKVHLASEKKKSSPWLKTKTNSETITKIKLNTPNYKPRSSRVYLQIGVWTNVHTAAPPFRGRHRKLSASISLPSILFWHANPLCMSSITSTILSFSHIENISGFPSMPICCHVLQLTHWDKTFSFQIYSCFICIFHQCLLKHFTSSCANAEINIASLSFIAVKVNI